MTSAEAPNRLVTGLMAQLAATLSRPLDVLDREACFAAIGAESRIASLAGNTAVRPAFNRAVARALELSRTDLPPAFLERLAQRPATRLSVLLVAQPASLLREAALDVSVAVLHKHVVGVVLRTDRERLKQVFGEARVRMGAQDAALLHVPLTTLNTGPAPMSSLADVEAARAVILTCGLRVLAGFVALTEPALDRLFRLRLPQGVDAAPLPGMAELHCRHILKLLRRRIPAWAPFIG